MNAKLTLQKTWLVRSRVITVSKTSIEELLNGRIAARDATFFRDRKCSEEKLTEARSMPKKTSTEMKAHWYRMRDEVHKLFSVSGRLVWR